MRKILYILLIIATGNVAHGQEQPLKRQLHLQSVTSASILNGSRGFSGALQMVLGVAYKGTSLGAGVGLDYYRFRSVPVFAHLAQEFGKGEHIFFLYGDLGHNYDWLTEKNNKEYSGAMGNNFTGGLYYEAGFGLKIPFNNKDAFLLSAGYSYKRMQRAVINNFCPFVGPCSTDKDSYRYQMPRLAVKAGLTF